MKKLLCFTIGAALAGCATTAPGPGAHTTTAADWLGRPDAQAQFAACHKALWASEYPGKPYMERQSVDVDGQSHSVAIDSRSSMGRAVASSDDARYMNGCMSHAGYTWSPYTERVIAAVETCNKASTIEAERRTCIDATMARSGTVDTDKLP